MGTRQGTIVHAAPSALTTFDEHGHRLHALARVLTDDPALAEQLVLAVLLPGRSTPVDYRTHAADLHHVWAGLGHLPLYAGVRAVDVSPSSQVLADIHTLPDDQRAALGLCRFGGHSFRQAAETLALAPDVVAGLLGDALRALALPGTLVSAPSPAA